MIQVEITSPNIDKMARAAGRWPDIAGPVFEEYMLRAAETGRTILTDKIKEMNLIGVTGDLSRAWFAEVRRTDPDLQGVIGTNLVYAAPVEFGTKPHTPPLEPILRWAEIKLGDRSIGGAVWATIRKKGTMPHPYIARSKDRIGDSLDRLMAEALKVAVVRVAREMRA